MDPETTVTDANASNSSIDDSMLSSPDFKGAPADEQTGDVVADATTQAADDKTVDNTKNQEDRFDKDPRFQELIAQKNEAEAAKIEAEAKLTLLKQSPIGDMGIPAASGQVEAKDISTMTADELREWQEDDPVGYAKNILALATQSVKTSLSTENVREATIAGIEKTFTEYGKNNPSFNEMWDSGEIPKYMQDNPGNNAISAHMMLMGDKRMEAAIAKAVKETEERVIKNFQAKKNATVISSTSAARAPGNGVDAEIKDTQPHGGFVSVAASRLAAMRRASA